MTLPAGQISFGQVNTELSLSATAQISLNDTAVRSLAGVPSGQIAMSNLQGKSSVTVPGQPTGVSATATSPTTANLYFTPGSTGGATVTYTVGGGGSGSSLSSPIAVTGLSAGTTYNLFVTPSNSAGSGPASASASVTTPLAPPSFIGQAYGGGYYGGSINVSGTVYYLIVADRTVGQNTSLAYGVYGTASGSTNKSYGGGNSATAAAYGSPAAGFCEGVNSGGYTDWYMPSAYELQILYYFLKPDTTSNATDPGVLYNYVYGMNPNAVSPQPVNTLYTAGSPAQTSSATFQTTSSSQGFSSVRYLSSTEGTPGNTPAASAWPDPEYICAEINFSTGIMLGGLKNSSRAVRAIRRIAA